MTYSSKGEASYSGAGVVKSPFKEISLKLALLISGGLHILTPLLVWLLLFILAALGINLLLFNAPKPKVKDIEFKIVHAPEQKPLVPTKNRAERDTRAGGKHDPKKPESDDRKASPKATQKPQPKPKPKPSPKRPKAVKKPKPKPKPKQVVRKPKPKPKAQPKPPMPIPPVARAPKPKAPVNPLAPSVKIASAPKPMGPSVTTVGPITKNSSSSSSSGATGPAPVTLNSPAVATASGPSGSSARPSTGSNSFGSGGSLNPSPGNPRGAPGINARKDPDFGPYMAELQRRIKRNWRPPRRNKSKRVILLFTITKDGRLRQLKVYRTSGEPDTDRAAISAVQLAAPFKPLPRDFTGQSIDIQFTFDYNVFGVGGRSY